MVMSRAESLARAHEATRIKTKEGRIERAKAADTGVLSTKMRLYVVTHSDMTDKELALLTNTHTQKNTMSDLLSGRINGSIKLWDAVLEALDIEVGFRFK